MHLARRTTTAILLVDLWIGLAWTFSAPNRYMTPVYKPARTLLDFCPGDPARAWGILLLAVTVVALVGLARSDEDIIRFSLVAIAAFWAFWVFLDAIAAFAPGGSLTAPAFAAMMVIGHVRQPLDRARLAH